MWILQQQVRIAVIAIAAGQGVGVANGALVMAMHMNQLHCMSAKQALLHSSKIIVLIFCRAGNFQVPFDLPVTNPGTGAFVVQPVDIICKCKIKSVFYGGFRRQL